MSTSKDIADRRTNFDAGGSELLWKTAECPRSHLGNEIERIRYFEAAFIMGTGGISLKIASLVADACEDRIAFFFDLFALGAFERND